MTDYGLVVKNDNSDVLIDSLYKNYTVKQTSSELVYPYFEGELVTGASSAVHPIFAMKAGTYYNAFQSMEALVGGVHGNYRVLPEYNHNVTLYYRVYQGKYTATLPTYGLVVKNSSDEVVFSSEDDWMKIIGFYSASLGYGASTDITVNNADNYFVLTNPCGDWRTVANGAPDYDYEFYYRTRGFKKIDSTTIRINTYIYWQETVPDETSDQSWTNDCQLIEFEA